MPLFQPARYKIIHGGRGSAKSWSVSRALICIAASSKKKIFCGRETQKSIDESVHALNKNQIGLLGLENQFDAQETRILERAFGSQLIYGGLRQQGIANLKSLEDVDIAWIEEGQTLSKRSIEVFAPTIRKPGSEIWVTMNPELDTDPAFQRFILNPPPGAVVIEMNFSDNPWFTKELEEERLYTLEHDPEGYKTIWLGQCRAAVDGAIYTSEIQALQAGKRLRNVPVDPVLPVHTAWDLGWNDDTSIILFQKAASEARIVGHIRGTRKSLADYVADLNTLGYRWGTDILPHDAKAHRVETGKSTQELLTAMGRKVICLDVDDIEEGIRAARLLFPRLYMDESCQDLYNSLRRYRRSKNEKTGAFGPPLHDESSHDADAFRCMAVGIDQIGNTSAPQKIVYRRKMVA